MNSMANNTLDTTAGGDEDADLANADRGDEVATDQPADPAARDDKGRFTSKPAEVGDDGDPDRKTGDDDQDATVAAAGDADADDEHQDQDDEDEDDAAATAAAHAKTVPYARFKEVIEKANRLAAENAELKTGAKQADAEPDDPAAVINQALDALYGQVEQARADGDVAQAAKLQRQIDQNNRDLGKLASTVISRQAAFAAQQNVRYDTMLEALEAQIDELNPGSETFNAVLVKEMEFQVAAYEKMGLPAAAALQRAAKLMFDVDPFTPKTKHPSEASVTPMRKKPDVNKAVDTQRKQPPDASTRGVNKDSTKIHVAELSDEDFDQLPESKKRELRGDFG